MMKRSRNDDETLKNKENNSNKENDYIPEKDLFGESKYAYEGEVIKLSKKDFDQYEETFYAIPDLRAQLFSEDLYLANDEKGIKTQPRWFMYLGNRLKQVHTQMLPDYNKRKAQEEEDNNTGFTSFDPANIR
jgi:hypothetical protein